MNIEERLLQLEEMPFSREKEKMTENLFHISFWNSMDINQKVRLLQLLENNLACKEKRVPCRIKVIAKMPSMGKASYLTHETKISGWHLENGLPHLKATNAQMYCVILHEHEHISQYLDAYDNTKNDEKVESFRSNFANIIPYSDKSVIEYVEYRFQPIEYYAYQISESKTLKVFERLEQEYGQDEGFKSWNEIIVMASVDGLVQLYNQEYGCNASFDKIYQDIVEKISKGNKVK